MLSARAIVFTLLLLIAALFINFAPFLRAVQAEHIWTCDTEFEFGTEQDQCTFVEAPLRHLPVSMFQKPTETFEPWYELGNDMIEWFGMPSELPGDFFGAWQTVTLWIGIYTSGAICAVLIVIGAYVLSATTRSNDKRVTLEGSE